MLVRRSPRWVVWPAKLVWLPLLLMGMWLTFGIKLESESIGQDAWRMGLLIPEPAAWVDPVAVFTVGVVLAIVGLVAMAAYFYGPGPGRRLTLIEYPLFTWASYIFGILTFLSLFHFEGHVAAAGSSGFEWRFLTSLRTHPLDRILTAVAGTLWIICWLGSWGLTGGRWARRTPADPSQQEHRTQSD